MCEDETDTHSSAKQHWKSYRVVSAIMLPSYLAGIFVDNIVIDLLIGMHVRMSVDDGSKHDRLSLLLWVQ